MTSHDVLDEKENDAVIDNTPKPGGGTTAVVVEPDEAAHAVLTLAYTLCSIR